MSANKLKPLFEGIESDDFAAMVGIASSFNILQTCFLHDASVLELLATTNKNDLQKISHRIALLCRKRIDSRYSNPWDYAITAYLWILDNKDRDLAIKASHQVSEAKNLWWARHLSGYLLKKAQETAPLVAEKEVVEVDLPTLITRSGVVMGDETNKAFPTSNDRTENILDTSLDNYLSSSEPAKREPSMTDVNFKAAQGSQVPDISYNYWQLSLPSSFQQPSEKTQRAKWNRKSREATEEEWTGSEACASEVKVAA